MKLEKLQKELETKIKELILKVLKDLNISNYKISITFNKNHCGIFLDKEKISIIYMEYNADNKKDCFNIYVLGRIFVFFTTF